MGIVRVWSWSSREEFLIPGFVFRVYSLRFRDVSWSHRVHKSAARRRIYAQLRTNDARVRENDVQRRTLDAQVRENDARGREIHVQRRRNDAGRRETKKPTVGELFERCQVCSNRMLIN